MQFALVEQTQIGRHPVAGSENNHITGHQLAGLQALAMAAAPDRDLRCNALRQRRQRAFCLGFLPVADDRIDQHDTENHAGIRPFSEGGSDQASSHQHQYQRLGQLPKEAPPAGQPRLFSHQVGSVLGQPLSDLGIAQTERYIDPQPLRGMVGWQRVPAY